MRALLAWTKRGSGPFGFWAYYEVQVGPLVLQAVPGTQPMEWEARIPMVWTSSERFGSHEEAQLAAERYVAALADQIRSALAEASTPPRGVQE